MEVVSMRSTKLTAAIVLTIAMAGGFACSSDSGGDNGTGGKGGSGGTGGSAGRGGSGGSTGGSTGGSSSSGGTTGGSSSTGGTGGSTGGTGGSTGGTGGSGGSTGGTGGSTGGTGGSTGGTGGSTGGTGGSAGDGGKLDTMTDSSGGMEAGTGAFTIMGDFGMMGMNKCFKMGNTRTTGQRSPAIMWDGVPAGTMSLAVSLRDLQGGVHWVMYNIPPTEKGLAAALPGGTMPGAPAPMGSRQTGAWFGPGADGVHRYEYQVWALKVATVTGGSATAMYNNTLPPERIASAKIHACGNAGASCAGCPNGPNP
jgi:phosphatidylethanolamine-binding protein (PEBP) family uncharacterized protein